VAKKKYLVCKTQNLYNLAIVVAVRYLIVCAWLQVVSFVIRGISIALVEFMQVGVEVHGCESNDRKLIFLKKNFSSQIPRTKMYLLYVNFFHTLPL
jgi:hypothetical protein